MKHNSMYYSLVGINVGAAILASKYFFGFEVATLMILAYIVMSLIFVDAKIDWIGKNTKELNNI